MPFERLSPHRFALGNTPPKPSLLVRAVGVLIGGTAVTGLRAVAAPGLQHSVIMDGLTFVIGAVGGWFGVTAIPHFWRMARSGVRQDRAQWDALLVALEQLNDRPNVSMAKADPVALDIDIFARTADVHFNGRKGDHGMWHVILEGFGLTNRAETGRVSARISFQIEGIDGGTTSHFLNADDQCNHPYSQDLTILYAGQPLSGPIRTAWWGPVVDCEVGGKLRVVVTDTLTGRTVTQAIVPSWHIEPPQPGSV